MLQLLPANGKGNCISLMTSHSHYTHLTQEVDPSDGAVLEYRHDEGEVGFGRQWFAGQRAHGVCPRDCWVVEAVTQRQD